MSKEKDRTGNIVRNIMVGYMYRFIHMLMPFITRTIILQILGVEYLGLNTLFTSIFTFLNLAEFGFGNTLTYKMYEPAKNKDYKTLSTYVTVIRRIYVVVGMVMFSLGLLAMPFLPNIIGHDCPSDINIYILYMVYLLNTVIPYWGSGYCTSIFAAFQRLDLSNLINAGVSLALNIAQIIVLVSFKDYYPYIICIPVFTIISTVLLAGVRKKKYPEITIGKKMDLILLKETFISAMALFGHSLNYVIVSSADSLVISAVLGLSILGKYGNYYTIFSVVIGFIDVFIQSCLPSIGNLMLERNKNQIRKLFNAISFISYWISGWCGICLICLYQPFMKMWMGENMLLPFSTVILFAVYLYSYKGRAAVILFKDSVGMWQADWLKPYVSGLANIIINILLVKCIGLNGVLLSTIIVFMCINFPWESKVFLKRILPGEAKAFYGKFLTFLVVTVVVTILTVALCMVLPFRKPICQFIISSIICVIVPNLIYWVIYRKTDEFMYLKMKATQILSRR